MYSFTLSQFAMLYEAANDLNDLADAVFMLVMLSVISSKMVNLIVKRKVIAGMMKSLQHDPFYPQDAEEFRIDSKAADNINFFTLWYGIMTESTCTMLTLASFKRDIPRMELPYKAWMPFSITSPMTFWIAYLHQTLGLYIAANVDIGFDSFVINMMMMTCVQLKILKHRIGKINHTMNSAQSSYKNLFSIVHQMHLETKLIANCTKHHIAISEFADLQNDTFGVSVFLQYCAGSLILCASTFSVSQLEPFSADFMSLVIYVMCILIQIFIYCQYANEMTVASESIRDAIYAMDWTSLTVNAQKSLIIIMARTLQPIQFTIGHISLCLDSFSSVRTIIFSL
uniref:Odorant receptor n=1 Tax=Meteorus pulchricornis TaxID=51522 RepID=A0A1S5VFM8_9HYME|nr:olfactory receptor 41 [Meteorus pulchricornis]